jgi:hypothetical protein
MHIAEIVTDSRPEADSFLAGCEFVDDTSHVAVGVRRDEDMQGKWLAVVLNFDGEAENDLDHELTETDEDPIELYLEKFPGTVRYDRSS